MPRSLRCVTAAPDAALVTADADDETRWADAGSILDGTPTESARRRLAQFRRRMRAGLVAAFLVALVVGGLLGWAIASGTDDGARSGTGDSSSGWADVVALVLLAAGVVLLAVGLVRMWRAGAWRGSWSAPSLVLTRVQRKHLLDQVRGRRPADPARIRLARDVAGRLLRLRGIDWVFAGVVVTQVGTAVGDPSAFRWLYVAAFCLGFAVLLGLLRRQRAQAQAFLDRNPVPAAG